jgi:hypothetical protein
MKGSRAFKHIRELARPRSSDIPAHLRRLQPYRSTQRCGSQIRLRIAGEANLSRFAQMID